MQRIWNLAAALTITTVAGADVINVPGDAPTIQAGIDAAANGDIVLVAKGIYSGAGNRDLDPNGKAITIRSAHGPATCIIDCDSVARGFVIGDAVGPDTRIEGFTIRHGDATHGGGMLVTGSSPLIVRCVIRQCAAELGGAAYVSGGSPAFVACSFIDNQATVGDAGGVYNIDGGHPVFEGCLFAFNAATLFGGAIFSDLSAFTMNNCTLTENNAERGGGIANYAGVDMTLVNTIVYGNEAEEPDESQIMSTASIENIVYCCIQDLGPNVGGLGNIADDPQLDDSFSLGLGSACADAGHNWGAPLDRADLDGDGDTMEIAPFDLDGEGRISADEFDFDPGCGLGAVIDIGADERFLGPSDVVYGDLTGEGDIDAADLLVLLGAWGEGGACIADFNFDGTASVFDLLTLFARWSS